MFEIEFKPLALRQLKKLSRYSLVQIVHSIEKYLKHNPEKPSPPRIKKLRAKQQAAYRLREGEYRIFYDVLSTKVAILPILHKSETVKFYQKEKL